MAYVKLKYLNYVGTSEPNRGYPVSPKRGATDVLCKPATSGSSTGCRGFGLGFRAHAEPLGSYCD